MTDKITVEIPVDEAREIVKKYPDSCYIKLALEKYDEEHQRFYLGPVSKDQIQLLRSVISDRSKQLPSTALLEWLTDSPIPESQVERRKRWWVFSQEKWEELPTGQEFAFYLNSTGCVYRRRKFNSTHYSRPERFGMDYGVVALHGHKIMPLNPRDPYPTIEDFN